MPPIDVVADASVVLKWFHEEGEEEVPESRHLIELQQRGLIVLSVLDLTAYEIGNALIRGRPRIGAAGAATVIRAIAEICPRLELSASELDDATGLAERHGLTMYDAAYAAAARARRALLATLDRDLLASGLGRRPSEVIAEVSPEQKEEQRMAWSDAELAAELRRYTERAQANGMAGSSLHTYVDQAQRFLRWRSGDYRPHGIVADGRPVPAQAASSSELLDQVDAYVESARAAGLAPATVATYRLHATNFVRWLDRTFDPGATL